MGFFKKRLATRDLWTQVSHPVSAPDFSAEDAEALIAQGVNVNQPLPDGSSPLSRICLWGNIGVAKVLLEHGANPNVRTPGGVRPLHIVASNGYVELAKILVEAGAEVDARESSGNTALHDSVRRSEGLRAQMPELLVSLGADPSAENSQGLTPLDEFRVHYRRMLSLNEKRPGHEQENRVLAGDLNRLTLLFSR